MQVEIEILTTGYCKSEEFIAIRGGRNKTIEFHGLFVLIKHPQFGVMLFDSGYSNYIFEETKSFPNSLYTTLLPVFHNEKQSVKNQLLSRGINVDDVTYIFISHFHADHIGGIKDFPNAKFICNSKAYKQIKELEGFNAVRKALLKGLMPQDFEKRAFFYDLMPDIKTKNIEPIDKVYDYFGDGSIAIVDLPGHARGQYGIMLSDIKKGDFFFIADTCWLSESYRKNILPSRLAYFIFDNISEYKMSLNKVYHFYKKNPNTHIIPTHCPEVISKFCI